MTVYSSNTGGNDSLRARASHGQRGQMLVASALVMVALLGFLGLVIDAGNGYAARRQAQNAADAAAYAAVAYLASSTNPTDANVQAVITNYGPVDNGHVSVNFANPSCPGPPNCSSGAWYVNSAGGVIDASQGYVGSGAIPTGTVGVRVFPTRTVRTFVISALGFQSITASAAAARVYGPTNGLSTWLPNVSITTTGANGPLAAGYTQTGTTALPVIVALSDYNTQTAGQTRFGTAESLAPKRLGSGGFDWSGLTIDQASLGASTVNGILTGAPGYVANINIGTSVENDSGDKATDCQTLDGGTSPSWVNKIVWIPLVTVDSSHNAVVEGFGPFYYTGSDCTGNPKAVHGFWLNPKTLPPFPGTSGINTGGTGINTTGGIP